MITCGNNNSSSSSKIIFSNKIKCSNIKTFSIHKNSNSRDLLVKYSKLHCLLDTNNLYQAQPFPPQYKHPTRLVLAAANQGTLNCVLGKNLCYFVFFLFFILFLVIFIIDSMCHGHTYMHTMDTHTYKPSTHTHTHTHTHHKCMHMHVHIDTLMFNRDTQTIETSQMFSLLIHFE